MSKRRSGKPSSSGRRTHRGRPSARRPARRHPDLVDTVRSALDSGEPLAMWTLASTMLSASDPRLRGPFDPPDADGPSLADLVESLIGTELPETSALLAAMAELVVDDLQRVRIRRELRRRSSSVPEFLAGGRGLRARRAAGITDALGDGQNVAIEVIGPDGDPFTAVVYVDYNLGTVAKDGFVVPMDLDAMIAEGSKYAPPEAIIIETLDLADGRARATDAIKNGAMTYPPLESDSWPMDRPLIEAILRTMPAGGTGYEYHEWSEGELAGIAEQFLASPQGKPFRSRAARGLLELLLQYASGYGAADPWHHSPATVEILLTQWVPRHVVMPESELRPLPGLLRSLIRFCHAQRQVPAEMTDVTLEAVDEYENEFRSLIAGPGSGDQAGPLTNLFEALGALTRDGSMMPFPVELGDDDDVDEFENMTFDEVMAEFQRTSLRWLELEVGGPAALESLDEVALPDEAFRWGGIPGDIGPAVTAVLDVLDPHADAIGGRELRTVARRVLARAASGDPAVFRRKARPDTTAAAVCWAVARANGVLSGTGGGMTAKELWLHFGVTPANGRARSVLTAGGFEPDGSTLGSAELLTSAARRNIMARRDRLRKDLPDG